MEPFITLGISLGLGLLVGVQRERTENRLGGIRTFPLISLLGTFCGFLAVRHGVWVLAAGLVSVFGIVAISNFLRARAEEVEFGQTTEVAALLTFAIGAYLVEGSRAVAIVAAGILVVLLHAKEPMHYFVEKMGRQDMAGVVQFVVISLIILPLLPNRAYGPFAVLNPFDIWRMVVLIVGISLAGYVAYKILGQRIGTFLGGALGGLISSTATTVSYARRTKATPGAAMLAVMAILIASAIAYVRVLVELAVIARSHLGEMILPLAAMTIWMFALSGAAYWMQSTREQDLPAASNPAELKSALAFGAIYAVVLFAVAAAKQQFGPTALYAVAVISGLTDMDAITLSIARMVEADRLPGAQGWRLILVASLANLVFKGLAASFLGGRRLAIRVGLFFAAGMLIGLVILWLWPGSWTLPSGSGGNQG